MYKAIFFDRDGTLTHPNREKLIWMHETVSRWSGKPFALPYEKMIALFDKAGYGSVKDVESEKRFRLQYYCDLLKGEGVSENIEIRALQLFDALWCENNPPVPYPETVQALEYFRARGYRMGVISDTSPSLELTMQKAGLSKYFDSFTASALVGAEKPSPVIFNAALHSLGVSAAESLYVDDYDVEADGARKLGFTSFLIDRGGGHSGPWVIDSLTKIVDFMEAIGKGA